MASDWQNLEKRLKKQGFVIDRTRRHVRITHPDHPGSVYVAASTPSDHRALKNCASALSRMFGYQKR